MYTFYFQIQFHKWCQYGKVYILQVHTNYTDRLKVRNQAIKDARNKWGCLRSDFEIQTVTLNSLLSLLNFKDNVAQLGET